MICLFYIWILLFPVKTEYADIRFLSPERVVVDPLNDMAYITCATAGQIARFDLKENQPMSPIGLPFDPTGLALDEKRDLLFVSGGQDQGELLFLDQESHHEIASIHVGHYPGSMCVAPKSGRLFVIHPYAGELSVIDIEERKLIGRIPIGGEPSALEISPDENLVIVANSLIPEIKLIDSQALTVTGSIRLPPGSVGMKDLCFSRDGSFLYVTHQCARYYVPATQVNNGWLNNGALSIIQADEMKYITTLLLDDKDRGASGPGGIGLSEDDSLLFITVSGTHELLLIDHRQMHERLRITKADMLEEIPYSTTFLTGIKRRIPLHGKGPRFLALDKEQVIVPAYFSAGMNLVSSAHGFTPSFIQLGKESEPTMERLGEQHFHDASIAYQGWQSCGSCHLGGGRMDGLSWDLPGDGFGNPKNTKSLLASGDTPPVNHLGNVPDLSTAVRSGIKGSIFVQLEEQYALEIESYIASLQAVTSPHLDHGQLNSSALRGQELFEESGCSACHKGPFFTDLKKYDVGSGAGRDKGLLFDTPTLLEIWRTGPYLNDGRAESLEEVLTQYNPQDRHGHTSQLSPEEVRDLVEYISSL